MLNQDFGLIKVYIASRSAIKDAESAEGPTMLGKFAFYLDPCISAHTQGTEISASC